MGSSLRPRFLARRRARRGPSRDPTSVQPAPRLTACSPAPRLTVVVVLGLLAAPSRKNLRFFLASLLLRWSLPFDPLPLPPGLPKSGDKLRPLPLAFAAALGPASSSAGGLSFLLSSLLDPLPLLFGLLAAGDNLRPLPPSLGFATLGLRCLALLFEDDPSSLAVPGLLFLFFRLLFCPSHGDGGQRCFGTDGAELPHSMRRASLSLYLAGRGWGRTQSRKHTPQGLGAR